jgi:uncharacterized protein (UPF0548 family)
VLSLGRPSRNTVDALLREQRQADFSYPDVGATDGPFPHGYRHARHTVELGQGPDVFDRAAEGLRRWQAHVRAGVAVHPPDAGVEPGLAVVLSVPLVAALHVTVACRVVYVVEQPARSGFAYGTLSHHVIEGEEAFVVERDDTATVRFSISAFLRPRRLATRAVAPLVEAIDHRLVRRYLEGLRRHVAGTPAG